MLHKIFATATHAYTQAHTHTQTQRQSVSSVMWMGQGQKASSWLASVKLNDGYCAQRPTHTHTLATKIHTHLDRHTHTLVGRLVNRVALDTCAAGRTMCGKYEIPCKTMQHLRPDNAVEPCEGGLSISSQ